MKACSFSSDLLVCKQKTCYHICLHNTESWALYLAYDTTTETQILVYHIIKQRPENQKLGKKELIMKNFNWNFDYVPLKSVQQFHNERNL